MHLHAAQYFTAAACQRVFRLCSLLDERKDGSNLSHTPLKKGSKFNPRLPV